MKGEVKNRKQKILLCIVPLIIHLSLVLIAFILSKDIYNRLPPRSDSSVIYWQKLTAFTAYRTFNWLWIILAYSTIGLTPTIYMAISYVISKDEKRLIRHKGAIVICMVFNAIYAVPYFLVMLFLLVMGFGGAGYSPHQIIYIFGIIPASIYMGMSINYVDDIFAAVRYKRIVKKERIT